MEPEADEEKKYAEGWEGRNNRTRGHVKEEGGGGGGGIEWVGGVSV
jgi:hypothetical protein